MHPNGVGILDGRTVRRHWGNTFPRLVAQIQLQVSPCHEHEVAKRSATYRSLANDIPIVLHKGHAGVVERDLEVGLVQDKYLSRQVGHRWSTCILPEYAKARCGRRRGRNRNRVRQEAGTRYRSFQSDCEGLAPRALR